MTAHLKTPRSDRTRSYIPNRIARLKQRKGRVELLAWAVVALGIGEVFTGSVPIGAAIAGLALLGRGVALDVCNLYIDTLVEHWANLDRDMAMGDLHNTDISGWEIPMDVPAKPF